MRKDDAMLKVDGLRKVYRSGSREVEALRDLTFTVEAGELVCLVGPSGCGKTTLLRCVAGLLEPTGGEVFVDGGPVAGPPPGMAVVFQEYGRSLFPWMSVRDNVELPLRRKKMPRSRRRELVAEALASVGLDGTESAYPWQLSGGMQQRVAIARAVAYEPTILLMDEPFAAVDAQTRADLEDLVRSLWRRLGVTILFVTHDIDEAVYLGQRVLMLSASPTVVQDELTVDLPAERDQLHTRADPRFTAQRAHVYAQIQAAKARTGTASGAAGELSSADR
ncbi:ABC transporter ATP-binding protein [Amorphoplanes digitatis]|uniref:NitT/TauT family transport system ATP-binding protein n=1 Tax=Actinoplanes digitatis TaxID=1868 RepID=A0A7W7HXU9_9ACTN|nr:ABC transporter ATP-binding protein [Actinoplanes digitatis]MBB4762774.1 NitT/TauT family transport system ATP-binding protein [Actinoplanes digitatis]